MGERRRQPRVRKRLGCEIRAGTRHFFGMALNVSIEGLFIQTRARIAPGTAVELTLGAQNERVRLTLRGSVVRAVQSPARRASAGCGGIGVRLIDPSPAYLGFVSGLLDGPNPLPPPPMELEGSFEFRVEMQTVDGAETRTLLVSCHSEAEATELAETELDEGWKVLSVARV